MLYLNENDLNEIGISWDNTLEIISNTISSLGTNDYSQPIKPYLRYGNPKNRIIAMPAYVGGTCDMAGIKWIASYPDNISQGIPRAHSVVVLNNSNTGVIESIINTPLLSIIRTASVTGFLINEVHKVRNYKNINIGILGYGPIGQYHFDMCNHVLKGCINKFYMYDIRPILDTHKLSEKYSVPVHAALSWQELYDNCDIVICCTVCQKPYIDKAPKEGALVLNISLRDFTLDSYQYLNKHIIVDEWEEVCREATTIEDWHKTYGLEEDDTLTLVDVLSNNCISTIPKEDNIFFCPMGMAVFDIAMASYFYNSAKKMTIGNEII